jgi:predicted AAA+ superfamily ATPase
MGYLERDAYSKMIRWKDNRDKADKGLFPRKKALCLEGPRQAGKSYLADKLAREYYKNVVKIDLSDPEVIGKINTFVDNYDPHQPYWESLFPILASNFIDSPDTVVVFDEVQLSTIVYNSIRSFLNNWKFHFIMTGSYLGFIELSRDFFIPAGDLYTVEVMPLTFPEFLKATGMHEKYMALDLFGASSSSDYDAIRQQYKIYMRVGGFPEAVNSYLQNGSEAMVSEVQNDIMRFFIKESGAYIKPSIDLEQFMATASMMPNYLLREKRGKTIDYNLFLKQDGVKLDYSNVLSSIRWMCSCGILGYCGKVVNGELFGRARLFYKDVGIAYNEMSKSMVNRANMLGWLAEDFVYIHLSQREGILPQPPAFGIYNEGEIDFWVVGRQSDATTCIDVKVGKGSSPTDDALLKSKKMVDYVLYARQESNGGKGIGSAAETNVFTIPIFLIDRFDFNMPRLRSS